MADLPARLARHLRRLYPADQVRRAAAVRDAARQPFGRAWMERHYGHYLKSEPSRLHLDLAGLLGPFHLTRGRRENVRAPRGAAKTTWANKGYVTWAVAERVEPFVLILSETAEQANTFVRDIADEFEGNPAIAAGYPAAAGKGPIWQQGKLRLRNGCQVQGRGVGGSIRGLTKGADRPTLIVVDDPNEDDDAYSPTLRRRKLQWFNKAVMEVGGPDTNVIVLGTPIHREAIVCELSRNGAWQTRSYKSVVRWPDRVDLWAEWERKLMTLSDPGRLETAAAFYAANRAAMDAGAEVLWPAREPLYTLMLKRATAGPAAFASEKQDEPGTDGATEWPAELFDWAGFYFDEWPADLVLRVQSLDPSKGTGSKAADYQAHVMLGLGRDGTLYADAELRREHDYVGRMLDLAALWRPDVAVAETNNTMGLLVPEIERQLQERKDAGRPVALNYEEVYHTLPKLARVRCLSGYIARKQLRVRNTPGGRMLADQLRDVPNGEYDDGPDALATTVRKLEEVVNGRQ